MMTPSSEFLSALAEILDVDVAEMKPDFSFEDGSWDSLAVVSVASLIDTEYGKTIDGEKLSSCNSIQDLMVLIDNFLG